MPSDPINFGWQMQPTFPLQKALSIWPRFKMFFSRRVVGWSMSALQDAELMVRALQMAVRSRHPAEVIHHSKSWLSVHFTEVSTGVCRGEREALHGIDRRMLRQCHGGKSVCNVGDRVNRSPTATTVLYPCGGEPRSFSLLRRLL